MIEVVGMASSWTVGCLIAVVLGYWFLAISGRRVGGSTLRAPWSWSLLALGSVAGVELYRLGMPSGGSDGFLTVQFAAAITTLLPAMALLGAQRPHHRIWQLVVLSLWVILVLPAARSALLEPAAVFHVDPPWGWFLWVLIAVGLLNRLGTRYLLPALLVAVGQGLLLAGQLPGIERELGVQGTLGALICFVLAMLVVVLQLRVSQPPEPATGFDRAWFDFRDLYGVLWALRVADRINVLAERHQWQVRLNWGGLSRVGDGSGESELSPPQQEVLHQNMRNLLRRFVSSEWIQSRLPGGEAAESTELTS